MQKVRRKSRTFGVHYIDLRPPIIKNSTAGPLHIWMSTEENEGYIQCEKLALLDMSFRGYKKVDRLPISEMVNISDAIQGIFEYV